MVLFTHPVAASLSPLSHLCFVFLHAMYLHKGWFVTFRVLSLKVTVKTVTSHQLRSPAKTSRCTTSAEDIHGRVNLNGNGEYNVYIYMYIYIHIYTYTCIHTYFIFFSCTYTRVNTAVLNISSKMSQCLIMGVITLATEGGQACRCIDYMEHSSTLSCCYLRGEWLTELITFRPAEAHARKLKKADWNISSYLFDRDVLLRLWIVKTLQTDRYIKQIWQH